MVVLHPKTQDAITAYVKSPAHAVMLVGPDGAGKGTVAKMLASQVLETPEDSLVARQAFKHIEPDEKNTISIETIRQLQQYVKLKTTGTAFVRRLILIEHADRMTTEAQNAFLKLLEEPPADTIILITAAHVTALLPTIRSRVQQLTVTIPAKETLIGAFGKNQPADRVTQAFFLSGGLPGLMAALLAEDTMHPLVTSVVEAKQVLQQPLMERLLHIEPLSKQKEQAVLLCEALERIAGAGLQQAAAKNDQVRLQKWHGILKQSHTAKMQFQANGNTKLVLTNLLLQI
jgi:DNA polymerase-3 subunit delta'